MNPVHITVVLPVYNDVEALRSAIPKSLEALTEFGKTVELIGAEDGSSDGSRE